MIRAGLFALPLLAAGLLASCVAPPLYVGPRSTVGSGDAGPGYTGLIRNGVARRSTGRELTTGSEVPRDALGNPVLPDVTQAAAKSRHRRKHWFGL